MHDNGVISAKVRWLQFVESYGNDPLDAVMSI